MSHFSFDRSKLRTQYRATEVSNAMDEARGFTEDCDTPAVISAEEHFTTGASQFDASIAPGDLKLFLVWGEGLDAALV